MARFSIYSADGQTVRYAGKPKYNGTFGGVSYVEFSQIASPTLIDFHVGDYVDYSRTGFRYKLYSVPLPTKKSGNNTVGDSYIYKNVQLHCATKDLELAPFRDLVLNDNLIHFTTLPTISVYDDVYGIADRIQACMDDFAGTGVWNITVMNTSDPAVLTVLQQEKEYSVSGVSCLEALNEIYKQWSGIGWVYSVVNGVNTITLGRPNVQDAGNTTDVFSYGLGNGLTVIAQAVSSKNEMATRLYAYGSDRNMPPRYYNTTTPTIFSKDSVYIPNLMIPRNYWGTTSSRRDARKAYVENVAAISQYGLIPKTIYFDGSGDYEEIYPSLEGVTFAELRAAMSSGTQYRPTSIYPDADFVNTIKSVVNPTDNGIVETSGNRYSYSGTYQVPAISLTEQYIEGQSVVNFTVALGEMPALDAGDMIFSYPNAFTVECQDAIEVQAYMVVAVDGAVRQTTPLNVRFTRLDCFFEVPTIVQRVEQSEVVKYTINVTVKLAQAQTGGYCYMTAPSCIRTLSIKNKVSDTFSVTLKQIGFDISQQGGVLSDGLATLSMKNGMCGGREFVIKSCTYDSLQDQWDLECYRQKDDSLGQYFPNSIYPIAANDSYVLVDMMMPKIYVQSAEERLYERASQVLAQMSKPKIIYNPEVDAKVLALAPETILEGMYMPVYDENLIPTTEQSYPHTTWVLISSLVIAEDESAIPTYKVTLQDEKAGSFLQSLTSEMSANARRARQVAVSESRSAYIDVEPETKSVAPYVEIAASSEFFSYPTGEATPTEGTIVLQAILHDIFGQPTYQWYYYGNSGWAQIPGATEQAYVVDPDSSLYYPTGDDVAEFKVIVRDPYVLNQWESEKTIVKLSAGQGADGLTVMLSNPAHVFAAGANGYAYSGTDTLYVYAFRGTTRLATTIGTITGAVTGLTATRNDNGTDHASVIVSAGTNLNQNGTLVIPVTADGVTVDMRYGWTLAARGQNGTDGEDGDDGEDGYNTATATLYKRAASQPTVPSARLTFWFADGSITGTLDNWSQVPPATNANHDPLWMITAYCVSRTGRYDILSSEWNGPVRFANDGAGSTGKTLRGPTVYNSSFPYQGEQGTGTYIDLVYNVVNGQIDRTKMYYCIQDCTGVLPTNGSFWRQATVQDFVATKVLYSSYGFVENLGANAVKIQDSGGVIYGGMMPPQTDGNGTYLAWWGGSSPANATVKIDQSGAIFANAGIFSGFLQMPFENLTTAATYVSTRNYRLGNKCNLLFEGYSTQETTLNLPYTSDQNGKVVNIFDFPIKTQSTVGSLKIQTGSGLLFIPGVTQGNYGLYPQTYIRGGRGGFIQLVAVELGGTVYWVVTVNSLTDYTYG